MTLPTFPPADQCDPEDLDAIADLVVRDPRASWDLAGSREHIEALCRRYQTLAQERDALQRHIDVLGPERFDAEVAAAANQRDLKSARVQISRLESTIDAERNERQAEVLQAEADRERADNAQALVEIHETIARSALAIVTRPGAIDLAELVRAVDERIAQALVRVVGHNARLSQQLENSLRRLEEIKQTAANSERIRSALADACLGITGQTIEQVNIQLDEELAAHPDLDPLHHARDMRDYQEDKTP